MFGSIGSRIMLDDTLSHAAQRATGFVGIARNDMLYHLLVDCLWNMNDKTFSYHNNFASKLSSTLSRFMVQRSSLRYFHPPSASRVTILQRSILLAIRSAAWSDAPQEGPAKMPSWSFSWRVRLIESRLDIRILASSTDWSSTGGTKPSSRLRNPCTP